MALELE